jgi:hypothetical protein
MVPSDWHKESWLVNNNGNTTTTLTAIQIWAVGQTYTDPCHWRSTTLEPPLGPTVDDLATALENQLTREATVSDITLDGYSGKLVKMTVPMDAVFTECDAGEFRSWTGPLSPNDSRYHQGPGQHDDVCILDVDGHRLAMRSTTTARPSMTGPCSSRCLTPSRSSRRPRPGSDRMTGRVGVRAGPTT